MALINSMDNNGYANENRFHYWVKICKNAELSGKESFWHCSCGSMDVNEYSFNVVGW